MNINEALLYIETQIAHHGAMLEKYMLAKQVLEEAAKRRPKSDEAVAAVPTKRRGRPGPKTPAKQAETEPHRQRLLEILADGPLSNLAVIRAMWGDKPTKVERDACYNRLLALSSKGLIIRLEDGRWARTDDPNRHEVAA